MAKLLCVLLVAFLSCSALIAVSYDLLGEPPLFPFSTHGQEARAVISTAFVATGFLSWIVFLSASKKRTLLNLFIAALSAQASLTVYAILSWSTPSTWLNPSTFFAEYNWLTFIFEVSPALSIIVSVLLFGLVWKKPAPRGELAGNSGTEKS